MYTTYAYTCCKQTVFAAAARAHLNTLYSIVHSQMSVRVRSHLREANCMCHVAKADLNKLNDAVVHTQLLHTQLSEEGP
jgi:hypothetical protein